MLQKLLQLENNISRLIEFKNRYNPEKIEKDFALQWALRYGIFESIQIIIDISCHIVNQYNLGIPESYKDCVNLLEKYSYIESNNAKQLKKMIGLRNLLIHEYTEIKIEQLYAFLNQITDFTDFAKAVKDYL
ncbi:type VII toxin-antitoxin system HepT family RNase toxin [Calditrichota bacterium GD2]